MKPWSPIWLPVVVADACGAGNEEAGKRTLDQLRFIGDALITNEATFCAALTASARNEQ